MTKKRFDFGKWAGLLVTLAVLSAGLIGSWYLQSYRIGQLEDAQKKRGEWMQKLSSDVASLKERCARIEGR